MTLIRVSVIWRVTYHPKSRMRGERGRKRGMGWRLAFVLNAAQWRGTKRRGEGGACGRVHVKGEGGSERGPYQGSRQRGAAHRGPRPSGAGGTVGARTREGCGRR
jgi:hypothetical protein